MLRCPKNMAEKKKTRKAKTMIEAVGLSKYYGRFTAVENLNFKISKGQIIGLLGPNGCGKSTTIGMILGLIKPTSGSINVDGVNIKKYANKISTLVFYNFKTYKIIK